MKAQEPGPSPESLEKARGLFDSFAMQADRSVCKCSGRGKRCPECVACIRGIALALDEAVRDTKERCAQVADFCAKEHPGHHGNCIASEIREV